jgi:hypothetical protein
MLTVDERQFEMGYAPLPVDYRCWWSVVCWGHSLPLCGPSFSDNYLNLISCLQFCRRAFATRDAIAENHPTQP